MSYCRWSECDVYAYDSCEGGVRFWVAGDDSLNRLCGTYNEAYKYAKELRDKHGLDVPSHAIDALLEDAIDEAKRYQGPDGAFAHMLDENAKLWELGEQYETVLADYRSEVAKLRELVAELYQCSRQYGCDRCGYKDGCAMFDRMAQLGVEVDA